METSNSSVNDAVFHAQNDRRGLGLIETSNSDDNHVVLHAQNDRWGLAPMETSISVLITVFFVHKTTGEDWDS